MKWQKNKKWKWINRGAFVVLAIFVTASSFFVWPDMRAYVAKHYEARQFRQYLSTLKPSTPEEFWRYAHDMLEYQINHPNLFDPEVPELVNILLPPTTDVSGWEGERMWRTLWGERGFRDYAINVLQEALQHRISWPEWDEPTKLSYHVDAKDLAVKGGASLVVGGMTFVTLLCLPWMIVLFVGIVAVYGKSTGVSIHLPSNPDHIVTLQSTDGGGEHQVDQSAQDASSEDRPSFPNPVELGVIRLPQFHATVNPACQLMTSRAPPSLERRMQCCVTSSS